MGSIAFKLVDLMCDGHMPDGRHMIKLGGLKHDPLMLAIVDSNSRVYRIVAVLKMPMALPDMVGGLKAVL